MVNYTSTLLYKQTLKINVLLIILRHELAPIDSCFALSLHINILNLGNNRRFICRSPLVNFKGLVQVVNLNILQKYFSLSMSLWPITKCRIVQSKILKTIFCHNKLKHPIVTYSIMSILKVFWFVKLSLLC